MIVAGSLLALLTAGGCATLQPWERGRLADRSMVFDADGELINEATADFLKTYGQAFSAWIEKVLAEEKIAA